jgi:hypothetical protein
MLRASGVLSVRMAVGGLFSATNVDLRHKYGPVQGHKRRTYHGARWWLKATGEGTLSAKEIDQKSSRPGMSNFPEEVDRPYVVPDGCTCFQCKKGIDKDAVRHTYVWVPSGNAAVPTKAGYFFHHGCFRCQKCKMRLFGNKFYSQDDQALCVPCALGRHVELPMRWWHTPRVGPGRSSSRRSGHEFPRHKKQVEFTYDPTA